MCCHRLLLAGKIPQQPVNFFAQRLAALASERSFSWPFSCCNLSGSCGGRDSCADSTSRAPGAANRSPLPHSRSRAAVTLPAVGFSPAASSSCQTSACSSGVREVKGRSTDSTAGGSKPASRKLSRISAATSHRYARLCSSAKLFPAISLKTRVVFALQPAALNFSRRPALLHTTAP